MIFKKLNTGVMLLLCAFAVGCQPKVYLMPSPVGTLAKDMLVWNVTKESINVREVVYNENVWTEPIVNKGSQSFLLSPSCCIIISGQRGKASL